MTSEYLIEGVYLNLLTPPFFNTGLISFFKKTIINNVCEKQFCILISIQDPGYFLYRPDFDSFSALWGISGNIFR